MDKLENWEKPWVRDFRGTNRSRPSPIDRGTGKKPISLPIDSRPWAQRLRENIQEKLGAFANARGVEPPVAKRKREMKVESMPVGKVSQADAKIMVKNKGVIWSEMQKHPQTIPHVQSKQSIALAMGMLENYKLSADYPLGDVYPMPRAELQQPKLDVRGLSNSTKSAQLSQWRRLPSAWGDPSEAVKSIALHGDLNKRGDAANYGLYKMNWYMIKKTEAGRKLIEQAVATTQYRGKTPSEDIGIQHLVGKWLNADTAKATGVLADAMAKWSMKAPDSYSLRNEHEPGNFWAGHRMGQRGLDGDPSIDWQDIRRYYDSVQLIRFEMERDKDIWHNDNRVGVWVPNI